MWCNLVLTMTVSCYYPRWCHVPFCVWLYAWTYMYPYKINVYLKNKQICNLIYNICKYPLKDVYRSEKGWICFLVPRDGVAKRYVRKMGFSSLCAVGFLCMSKGRVNVRSYDLHRVREKYVPLSVLTRPNSDPRGSLRWNKHPSFCIWSTKLFHEIVQPWAHESRLSQLSGIRAKSSNICTTWVLGSWGSAFWKTPGTREGGG